MFCSIYSLCQRIDPLQEMALLMTRYSTCAVYCFIWRGSFGELTIARLRFRVQRQHHLETRKYGLESWTAMVSNFHLGYKSCLWCIASPFLALSMLNLQRSPVEDCPSGTEWGMAGLHHGPDDKRTHPHQTLPCLWCIASSFLALSMHEWEKIESVRLKRAEWGMNELRHGQGHAITRTAILVWNVLYTINAPCSVHAIPTWRIDRTRLKRTVWGAAEPHHVHCRSLQACR